MTKSKFAKGLWSVLLALPLSVSAAQRPNILLLMAEDMSARVGAFGDPVAVTPNLDALAAEGVRYTNTFTTAGVCAPSRAAHILGMHQIATGTQHMRSSSRPGGGYYSVPPVEAKAYPELLRRAGYYSYTDAKLDYQFSGPMAGSGPPTIWDEEWAAATGWRNRAAGQPFFGFINFAVTHESGVFRPLGSWPESPVHFAMQLMRWWQLEEPVAAVVQPEDVTLPPYYPDTPVVRADVARHYNNIAHMDGEVGEILRQLEVDGLADSTVVIWTTDHGDGLPRAKRELFDSGIRVPMIVRWPEAFRPPGVEPGQVDARLVSFVDLAPTILSLAGVPVPAHMHGTNFSDVSRAPRRYIYASRDRIDEVMDRQRAVRDSRYKYLRSWYPGQPGGHALRFRDNLDMVREMHGLYESGELDALQRQWYEPPGEERLFDLARDPHEVNDVSRDPRYEVVLQRMRGEMAAWLSRVGDWSEEPEDDMVARFEPGGERQITPSPTLSREGGAVALAPRAPGHSLEYRLDGGRWQLYVGPLDAASAQGVEARAVRYGWEESDVVELP